jgi:phage gpG-like protein
MPEITVKVEGADEAREGMKRMADAMPGSIYAAVVESCALVQKQAQTVHLAGATLNYRTHRLQQSVKMDVRTDGKKVVGRVGSAVVYAAIHEFGGVIVPKNAKFLCFQIEGRWIRTKKVTMPAREWLLKSVTDVQDKIEEIFGRKVEICIGGKAV